MNKNLTRCSWIAFIIFLNLSSYSCSLRTEKLHESSVSETQEKKPNIIFFLVDDQRNDILSIAGHPIIKTPTVDSLANNGTRFTNAFVTTSICAASRASILTGLYEIKHEYTFGKDPIKLAYMNQSYPLVLKKIGYQTGFIGKFGIQIEKKDSLIGEMFDFYKPSPKSGPHFVQLPDGRRRHSAEIKGDEAIKFINNQTKDHPFCLSVSFNAVHAVDGNKTPGNDGHFPYPQAVAHLFEDIKVPLPELSDPEIYNKHPEFLKKSLNRERYFWRWDTEEKYQVNMKAYFRMISGYDYVMKRVLQVLEEKGLAENTVVIFSSDNGYYMGNRGFAGKWSHYEESLRVPLVIYDPRLSSSGSEKISDKIALNIDIPATILDLAGIKQPELYQGKSLLPILNNEDIVNWRDDFYFEHRMNNEKIPKLFGVRGQRYVYANYYEQIPPYEYLHDLEKDPLQLENFVNHTEYKEILELMRNEAKAKEELLK